MTLRPRSPHPAPMIARPTGLALLIASEGLAGVLGFAATVHLARTLGAPAFAGVEYAVALAGVLLVLVRGGVEVIVFREAARRPRLMGPLTDLLLGLKLAGALLGLAVVSGFVILSDSGQGPLLLFAGTLLIPSALSPDVSARAGGRLAAVAAIGAVRASAFASLAFTLVLEPAHAPRAAALAMLAECVATVLFARDHARRHSPARPRFRRRAWIVLARRGLLAGVMRLARVGTYAVDILLLGLLAAPALGPYAATRRLGFAAVALGLVIPSALAPSIARAWASGAGPARDRLGRAGWLTLAFGLPAGLGMILAADRVTPALFGSGFESGGLSLALFGARLTPLLMGSLTGSALVACRREGEALRLTLAQLTLALMILPAAITLAGPVGAGLAMIGVELLGALVGWHALGRLAVTPPISKLAAGPTLACLPMAGAFTLAGPWPWPVACSLAGMVYATALGLILLAARPRLGPNLEGFAS